MKAFQFRLERVLSWRQTQLALEEAVLERLRSDLYAIGIMVSELATRGAAPAESMKPMRSVAGPDIADVARFREWAVREEKRLRERMAECKRQIESRTETVQEARRKVRLVERLKERRREDWEAAFEGELDQLAGESAISSWRRGRSS